MTDGGAQGRRSAPVPHLVAHALNATDEQLPLLSRLRSAGAKVNADAEAAGVQLEPVAVARALRSAALGYLSAEATRILCSNPDGWVRQLESNRADRLICPKMSGDDRRSWPWLRMNDHLWSEWGKLSATTRQATYPFTYDDARLIPMFNTLIEVQYSVIDQLNNGWSPAPRVSALIAAYETLDDEFKDVADAYLSGLSRKPVEDRQDAEFRMALIHLLRIENWVQATKGNAAANSESIYKPILVLNVRAAEMNLCADETHEYVHRRRRQLRALADVRGGLDLPVKKVDMRSWDSLRVAGGTFALHPDPERPHASRKLIGNCAGSSASLTTDVDPVLTVIDLANAIARQCAYPYCWTNDGMVERAAGDAAQPFAERATERSPRTL